MQIYFEQLQTLLLTWLKKEPLELSEFLLIKKLQKENYEGFHNVSLNDNMALFKMHFILHHALYQLQQTLFTEQRYCLIISALKIQLLPYHAGDSALSEYDVVRDFYLNWNNFEAMTGEKLEHLLNNFWQKFYAKNDYQQALAIFGLKEPTNYELIKKRYRILVGQHHPDRGGDKEKLQQINQAMEILEKYYAAS